jgi:hypothetical protein
MVQASLRSVNQGLSDIASSGSEAGGAAAASLGQVTCARYVVGGRFRTPPVRGKGCAHL